MALYVTIVIKSDFEKISKDVNDNLKKKYEFFEGESFLEKEKLIE